MSIRFLQVELAADLTVVNLRVENVLSQNSLIHAIAGQSPTSRHLHFFYGIRNFFAGLIKARKVRKSVFPVCCFGNRSTILGFPTIGQQNHVDGSRPFQKILTVVVPDLISGNRHGSTRSFGSGDFMHVNIDDTVYNPIGGVIFRMVLEFNPVINLFMIFIILA